MEIEKIERDEEWLPNADGGSSLRLDKARVAVSMQYARVGETPGFESSGGRESHGILRRSTRPWRGHGRKDAD
jgi:hypothetical protein